MNTPIARILFVEDDVNLGFVIRDTLENVPFTVTHCTTSSDAWAMFETGSFDLCLLDVMLSSRYAGENNSDQNAGFALARRIRSVNTQIPILFLSALADKDARLQGLRLGADDYLTKPFSIEELILKINVFLKRSYTPIGVPAQLPNSVQFPDRDPTTTWLDRRNLTLHLNDQV